MTVGGQVALSPATQLVIRWVREWMNGSWACVILGESAVPTTATLTVEMKEAHLFRSLQNVPATTLRLHSAPRTGRRSGEMELWCRDFHTYVSLSVYRKETLKSNQTSEFCVRHHRGKKNKIHAWVTSEWFAHFSQMCPGMKAIPFVFVNKLP